MDSAEFNKLWNLYRALFPGHHSVENQNIRLAWRAALSPYALEDVTAASLAWVRRSKHFPNVAEITAGLPVPEEPERKLRSRAWMRPYIHKLRKEDADAAEQGPV